MKLTEIYPELYEANLMGRSRSGGDSNWNYYVVRNFDKNKTYNIESNADIVDGNFDKIGVAREGDTIQILSPELLLDKKSPYANVKLVKSKLEGFIHIKHIQKPTTRSEGSVIPGGKASKEFTPEKLGLVGSKFSNANSAAKEIQSKLKSVYGDDEYINVRMYLYDCINTTIGTSLSESFKKSYSLNQTHTISKSDVSILSKNFGEVLGALYILANNKKTQYVEFPKDIAQGLYDFIMVERNGITNYYSVKSFSGSSTSLANINFVLKHFTDTNAVLQKNKHEVDVIQTLFNNKEKGITTINNIVNFFDNYLKTKHRTIISELNNISKVRLRSLEQKDLDVWFKSMVDTVDKEKFIATMNYIYETVLGDVGRTPKATPKVLEEIYERKDGSKFNHGYIIYPMGSYIVNYLNETGNYKDVLNILLNYGSFVHQFTVSLDTASLQIAIASFKSESFRFSYNAGTKYPGNRPIGFIKD